VVSRTDPPEPRLLFDEFDLDIANARLWRAGVELHLPPRSFAVLAHLAQRPGELVLKDDLLDTVWGRRFVSEGAVKTVVSELRAALGDHARAPRWIETVQRRGYRFLGAVRTPPGNAPVDAMSPPVPPRVAARGNLPTGLPALVGRADACDHLVSLLGSARLVTVCGPAGVGKTSLSLAVADGLRKRFADGVWLVELAPLPADSTDAAALRSALARSLLLPPASVSTDADLTVALQGACRLLVLDNAEHVLEPLAPLVAALQRGLPDMQWLVTSREPLQIPGEQLLRLTPLSLPAADEDDAHSQLTDSGAMQLLSQRVAARLPGFAPGPGQRRAMADVCRALDGLPLALELAAARVPVLGLHGLAAHLAAGGPGDGSAAGAPGNQLALLIQAHRTAEPHQRSLRSALDWSHALLKPAEQRAFRRLAVFRGGFTLPAAQCVCGDPGEPPLAVLDALEALVEKSMVAVPPHSDVEGGPRFTLLESLREYAAERLRDAGETAATHRRHLAWMRAFWRRADATALMEPSVAWTARQMPELDNLRVALRWAQAQCGPDAAAHAQDVVADWLALVGHAALFWQRAGLLAESAPWCHAVRPLADHHPDPLLRAGVDLAMAGLSYQTALPPPAQGLHLSQRAVDACLQAGDTVRAYFGLYLCWALALEMGEDVERNSYVLRMRALVRPDWHVLLQRYVRLAAAQDQRLLGNFDAFLATSREDYARFRALGAQGESWSAGLGLIWAEHDQGHPERALDIGAAVVDDIRAAGRLRTYAQLLAMHTTMRAESGDTARTRALLVEALPMLPTVKSCEVLYLALAWLATHEGRHEDAAQVAGWFDAPARGGGVFGPNTFTRRSATALQTRLDAGLGPARRQALQAAAGELGNEQAVAIGLGTPRTDEKPTSP
jgi:predicted ATPase/DNA-binding winged helix-turn-helix (wHTH) protein